jgi:hypothetical protein
VRSYGEIALLLTYGDTVNFEYETAFWPIHGRAKTAVQVVKRVKEFFYGTKPHLFLRKRGKTT